MSRGVTAMAREAGAAIIQPDDIYVLTIDRLERFAALVAAAERERCANFVESPIGRKLSEINDGPRQLAAAIRALKDGEE